MSLAEKLVNEFKDLNDYQKQEVIDFVEFLKKKNESKIECMMDEIIIDNREALEELGR
jgi:hypothetical protein